MAQQFRDLPQIPPSMDESDFSAWGFDQTSFAHPFKHNTEYFSVEDDIHLDTIDDFDGGMGSMQPMQRFMIDQGPAPLFNVRIPTGAKKERHYEPQWPTSDCFRNVSPDRTSASDVSSYATQNEFCSPIGYSVVPYGCALELSQSLLPYPTVENFSGGSHLCETQQHNISLRDLEYEHPELDTVMEDTIHVEVKQKETCIQELGNVESKTIPDSKYADSGIGNSVRDAESVQPIDNHEEPASDSDYDPTPTRPTRRRRSSASKGSTRPRRGPSRKNSRASNGSDPIKSRRRCRGASNASKSIVQIDTQTDDRKRFPCPLAPYGCVSNFSSKNEWKRHLSTQHFKLGYWRCDLCLPTTDPNDEQALYYNDFNRKDLFTQHLRRMHAAPKDSSADSTEEYPVNEDNLSEHQSRCFLALRTAPQQSTCLFCDRSFEGPTSWEDRIEHVGRHFEKDRASIHDMLDVASWNVDFGLERYLLDEGLIKKEKGEWKIGNGKPRRYSEVESDNESVEE